MLSLYRPADCIPNPHTPQPAYNTVWLEPCYAFQLPSRHASWKPSTYRNPTPPPTAAPPPTRQPVLLEQAPDVLAGPSARQLGGDHEQRIGVRRVAGVQRTQLGHLGSTRQWVRDVL